MVLPACCASPQLIAQGFWLTLWVGSAWISPHFKQRMLHRNEGSLFFGFNPHFKHSTPHTYLDAF